VIYADTSFLGSYFVPDANSQSALTVVQSLTASLAFTALHRLELRNALALAVFQGRITNHQAQAVWQDVERDLSSGLLLATSLKWYPILRKAALLSIQHTMTTGCRSLDVLHVATALKMGTTEFLSFDLRQRNLATTLGLNVKP
jgi:hypothetical protein